MVKYGKSTSMVFHSDEPEELSFDIYRNIDYGDIEIKQEVVATWNGKTYKLDYVGRQSNEGVVRIQRVLTEGDAASLAHYVRNVKRQPDYHWEERLTWVTSVWGLVDMYIEDAFGKYADLEKEKEAKNA